VTGGCEAPGLTGRVRSCGERDREAVPGLHLDRSFGVTDVASGIEARQGRDASRPGAEHEKPGPQREWRETPGCVCVAERLLRNGFVGGEGSNAQAEPGAGLILRDGFMSSRHPAPTDRIGDARLAAL
jgi:hypothetical protein